jgi:tetratricopeptide (TPR) repeat protein
MVKTQHNLYNLLLLAAFLIFVLPGCITKHYALNPRVSSASILPDPTIFKLINESEALYRENSFDQALKPLNKIIEIDKKNTQAYIQAGKIYLAKNDIKKAKENFEKAIALEPNDDRIYKNIGRIYSRKYEFYSDAKTMFKKGLILNPNSSEIYMELGHLYDLESSFVQDQNANHNLAEEMLKKAIDISPRNSYAYFHLAESYYNQNKLNLSEAAFLKALELSPNDFTFYLQLGKVYYAKNESAKAKRFLDMAIDMGPAMDSKYIIIGRTHSNFRDFVSAKSILMQALILNDTSSDLYAELGHVYSLESIFLFDRRENYRLAEEMLKKAIELNPKSSKAFSFLGFEYYNQLKFNLSEEAYLKARELDPSDIETLAGLSWVYLEQKKYSDAAKYASKVLERQPENFKMHELLGRVEYAEGNFDKAEGFMLKSVQLMKGSTSGCPFQALGILYTDMNVTDKSIDYFKKAANNEFNRHKSQFDAAIVCFDASEYSCALEYADRAIRLANLSTYYELKSLILIMQAKFDDAHEILKTLPENSRTLTEFGHIALAKKDFSNAESLFKKALQNSSFLKENERIVDSKKYYHMAIIGMGWVNANQNRHEEALAYYEEILKNESKNLLALVSKGNSLTGLKRYDEAEKVFQFANKIYPNNEYVKAELGLIHYYQGNYSEAETYFKSSLKNNNETYTCPYEGLGLVYFKQGKYEEAKENLQKSIDINPDIEYNKYNALAKIYIREGRIKEAKMLLNKSIENYPYDQEARTLLEAIG